jgi:hypothetical protein
VNLCVRWDFPTQTQLNQTQEAADRTISMPTTAAKPAELASVVALELLALRQQVDASSLLQSPLHLSLEATISPLLHWLGSLPAPPLTLKPVVLWVHFSLQQIFLSAAAQGLPVHFALSASVVSLAQVFASFVVAPDSFQPLAQDCWQHVPASEAAHEDPAQ